MVMNESTLRIAYLMLVVIALASLFIAILSFRASKHKVYEFIQKHGIKLDFGLATKAEVLEKFGEEIGTVILEERRIIFYRFGWVWALLGATIIIILAFLVRR